MRYYAGFARDPGTYLWRFDRKIAGSGALADIGSHFLHVAEWFYGQIEAVSAQLSVLVKRPPNPQGQAYEQADDSAMVTRDALTRFDFARGLQFEQRGSWFSDLHVSYHVGMFGFSLWLDALGVPNEVLNHHDSPRNLRFLPGIDRVRREPSEPADFGVVLDLDATHRLGSTREFFEAIPCALIDHHIHRVTIDKLKLQSFRRRCGDFAAAATGQS